MKRLTHEEIQKRSLAILKDIDSFCRANDIRYFVTYGTLLGAVRHKGFVPWDDDIDIAMPREDYDRFVKEYKSEDYEFIGLENNPDVYITLGRVTDTKKSYMVSSVPWHGTSVKTGLFIDIFPMDHVPEDKASRKKLYGSLRYLNTNSVRIRKAHVEILGDKKVLRSLFYRYFHPRLRLTDPTLLPRYVQYLVKTCSDPSSPLVSQFTYPDRKLWAFREDELYDLIDLPFEDITVRAPKMYDRFLRSIYGNYMQLPPKEKQHPTGQKFCSIFSTEE